MSHTLQGTGKLLNNDLGACPISITSCTGSHWTTIRIPQCSETFKILAQNLACHFFLLQFLWDYPWGSLTKIVTEGVRNLNGCQWKPYNSWRGVCHVLQSHLGQGTLVTTFKLLKWNVHHVRVDQTFKCPVRTTILTKFLKRRHDLDCRHYKTNCLNGMRFSEYRHWISLGALKKQIGSGWLVFLP